MGYLVDIYGFKVKK